MELTRAELYALREFAERRAEAEWFQVDHAPDGHLRVFDEKHARYFDLSPEVGKPGPYQKAMERRLGKRH